MLSACLRLSTLTCKLPFLVLSFQSSPCRNNFFYEERQELGGTNLLQRFNNNESGEVCCLILRVRFWKVLFSFFLFYLKMPYMLYIFRWACTITHHRVHLVLGMNPFALVETEISDQYTWVKVMFLNHCQFQVLNTGQIPILSKQLTLSHRLLAPNR